MSQRFSKCSPWTPGSSKDFQSVYEFKTNFIIILRHNLPFRRAVFTLSVIEGRSARALVSTNQGSGPKMVIVLVTTVYSQFFFIF